MQLIFVEDDDIIRVLVVEYLKEHGYDVAEAATAEDAMQFLVVNQAPQIVVTDIDLGAGQSGLELADWLHARWPNLSVIFASGQLDRLQGRTPDSRETYLAKPFRLGKLMELVHNIASPSTTRSDS